METQELVKALGEAIGIELSLDADGAASFEADGLVVTINDLPEIGALVLVGDLGDPPPVNLEELYKAMLESQYLFRDTGGATLSRNPENGHFALCRPLAAKALAAESFLESVSRFISTLQTWADVVRNYRGGEISRDSQPPVPSLDFIKV